MLLATDLDGTFLAGDPEKKLMLYELIRAHPEIELVFVTGRGLESVMPLLSDPAIPKPKYIICDVGCTIVHGDTLQAMLPMQSDIDSLWVGEHVIENALAHIDGLIRQDVPQERRVSYFCDVQTINAQVKNIVASLDCDWLYSANRYFDVLPRGVSKGSTLNALVKQLGVAFDSVLVAGDTLNDLSMYEHGFMGVCVGDSEPDLLEATRGKTRIFHAEETGCGGILQAFEYFGFLGAEGVQAELRTSLSPGKSDLVIVYHRLPYEEFIQNNVICQRRPKSPNGIIPTLLSFFANGRQGSWIAWSVHDPAMGAFQSHTKVDEERFKNLTCARIPLQQEEVDIFYKKFSKEAFWPTLHTFWERASFKEEHWEIFLEVNRKFAETTAAEAAENAVVWIHDYNLWMVPAYLRALRADLTIAFFHHTYFPSADVFNVLPWRKAIVSSLLQCDYIGFHIPRQAENFVDVARGVTPLTVTKRMGCAPRFLTYGCAVGLEEMSTEILVNERKIGLGAHPVGLDVSRIASILTHTETQTLMTQLRSEFASTKVIFSVERLDFTKGLLEKLEAFELLLTEHPELIQKVSLVTVCVPAAKGMAIYEELRVQIEQIVGRINGKFARVGWAPVQYFFRAFPFEALIAYYAIANVMWITPLRDGLNLVAKEYVATQGLTAGSGVLVLSEFAGAAAELKGAVLANPHDKRDLMNACYLGLNMGQKEAKLRLSEAFDVVRHYDIELWGQGFLEAVAHYQRIRLGQVPVKAA